MRTQIFTIKISVQHNVLDKARKSTKEISSSVIGLKDKDNGVYLALASHQGNERGSGGRRKCMPMKTKMRRCVSMRRRKRRSKNVEMRRRQERISGRRRGWKIFLFNVARKFK